jgi:hypothetical protein
VIFSATSVESGDPLLFSNTQAGNGVRGQGRRLPRFHQLYGGRLKVNVVTAARLSATFPFVSPAARPALRVCDPDEPERCAPDYHLVDGGYYDVSGVISLLDWLDDGLSDPALTELPQGLLILRIRPFAERIASDPGPSGWQRARSLARGWFFQNTAPVEGLYAMRGAAQQRNSLQHLQAFRQTWSDQAAVAATRGSEARPIRVSVVDITFPSFPPGNGCKEPPLSWRLNQQEESCLDDAWRILTSPNTSTARCLDAIRDWPSGKPVESHCEVR